MDNRYNRHNRRKYSLKVHIVLVTKYRPPPYKSTLKAKVMAKNLHGSSHLPREVGFHLQPNERILFMKSVRDPPEIINVLSNTRF